MRNSLARALPSPEGKSLAMRPASGETVGKSFADLSDPREMGRILERAIVLSGEEKKALAGAMGYTDASLLSRWIQGEPTAPIQFAKLWAVRWFRPFLVVALAEKTGGAVRVRTTIEIEGAA